MKFVDQEYYEVKDSRGMYGLPYQFTTKEAAVLMAEH